MTAPTVRAVRAVLEAAGLAHLVDNLKVQRTTVEVNLGDPLEGERRHLTSDPADALQVQAALAGSWPYARMLWPGQVLLPR